jgi:acyl transferase domain-containing protein
VTPVPVLQSYLFALATTSESELHRQAAAFAVLASRQGETSFASFVNRTVSRFGGGDIRLACVASDGETLAALLESARSGARRPNLFQGKARSRRKLMWVFPGHGVHSARSARGLFLSESAFREQMRECDAHVRELLGWSLIDRLLDAHYVADQSDAVAFQLIIFCTQISLAALWRAWGVEPDGVVGHSMGEIGAAYVAEAISLKDAINLLTKRSALLQGLRGAGAMAAIRLAPEAVGELLDEFEGRLVVAACNGRRATVVSGDANNLKKLVESLQLKGVRCDWLADTPGHSPLTEPAALELAQFARGLKPSKERIRFFSTVVGGALGGASLDGAYWGRNLSQPVRFTTAIDAALQEGFTEFLELSAQPILLPGIEENARSSGRDDVLVVPSLRRDRDERLTMLQAAAQLFVCGNGLNWGAIFGGGALEERVG